METLLWGLPWRSWGFWCTSHVGGVHHTNCYQIPVPPLLKNELHLSFPTRHTSRQVICKGRKGRWCPVLGWVKARTACSQTVPQPSLAITPGVQGLASRGASFPSCSSQTMVTAALTWPVFAPGYKGLCPVASASCPCLRLAVHFTSVSTRQTSRNSAVWTRQVYSQCILVPSALCAENFDWEFHKAPF